MVLHLSAKQFTLEILRKFLSFSFIYIIHIATIVPSLRLLDALSPHSPLYQILGLSRWFIFLITLVILRRQTGGPADHTAYFLSLFASAAALLFIENHFSAQLDDLFSYVGFSGHAVLALTAFSPLIAIWVFLEIISMVLSRLDLHFIHDTLHNTKS